MKQEYQYFTYILASKKNGTIYVGSTRNLFERVIQHKEGKGSEFTKKYKVNRLIYYEDMSDVYEMIARERQLKKWKRAWKINLIEKENPNWDDLFEDFL